MDFQTVQPQTSKVTTKGQVTIPADYREKLSIPPGTIVKLFLFDDLIIVDPHGKLSDLRGSLRPYAKKGAKYSKKKVRVLMAKEAASRYRKARGG